MSTATQHIEKKKTVMPQLRFPEFEEEWEMAKLGEVTEYIKGFAFKSEFYASEGTRIVRVSDLSARSIKNDNDQIFINDYRVEELTKYKINKGDIIITTVGSKPELLESAVGRGIFVNKSNEGLLNQNLLKFNCSEKIDNGFLFGYINTEKYINHIKEIKRGNANQANITVVDLLKYNIYRPSLPEQTKIASFLTAVDEKLTAVKKKKTLLEQYKKGLMQQIFSQELRFKDDNGNDFADWKEKKLGEYLIRHEEKATENKQYPVLTSSRRGLYFQKDYFNGQDIASSNTTGYNVVPRGYFTYRHMSDDTDFKFNVNNLCDKGIVSTLYPVFTTTDFLNDTFLVYKLNNGNEFKNYAILQKQGGSRTYMYFKKLEKLVMLFPSSGEQTKITNFLSAIDEKINHCQGQIDQTTIWKKGLLQQLFV